MEKYWIWFKTLEIRNIEKIELIKKYKNIEEIFNIFNGKITNEIEEICKYNKVNNILIVPIISNEYPILLKYTYNPPILIYCIGNISLLKKHCVTVYLGKNIDSYGRKIIKYVVNNLKDNNIRIVSTLQNSFKCDIGVLNCGITDKFYANDGVIISENEYYIKATKETTINRARILTGISKSTVIIQAELIDGVQYIVSSAVDENREIWVVPSDITRKNSIYTNELMKYGVNILTNYTELLVYEQNVNLLKYVNC